MQLILPSSGIGVNASVVTGKNKTKIFRRIIKFILKSCMLRFVVGFNR